MLFGKNLCLVSFVFFLAGFSVPIFADNNHPGHEEFAFCDAQGFIHNHDADGRGVCRSLAEWRDCRRRGLRGWTTSRSRCAPPTAAT